MVSTESEAARKAEIAAKRNQIASTYMERWNLFARSYSTPRDDDAVWLTCAGNYVLNTRGLKWAVDPYMLGSRLPEVPTHDVREAYRDLTFVLLTHAHGDHCDADLWHQLKGAPCRWIVPDHLVDYFCGDAGMSGVDFTVAIPGQDIEISGAIISPFSSPHFGRHLDGREILIEETGYLVQVNLRSYLFPGDVRTYDPSYVDPFMGVDAVFAHVFLGREAALLPVPPRLKEFVDFYLACKPRKVVLGHLYDFQAMIENCWVDTHATMVVQALRAADSGVLTVVPEWYQEIVL